MMENDGFEPRGSRNTLILKLSLATIWFISSYVFCMWIKNNPLISQTIHSTYKVYALQGGSLFEK
jgi:hypothetical protein